MTEENDKEYSQNKKPKVIPKSYYATKTDLENQQLRHGSPAPNAYSNIKTWRK